MHASAPLRGRSFASLFRKAASLSDGEARPLDRDPMELTDLHEEREDEVAELSALLDQYLEESTRLRETLLAEAGREDGGQSLDLDPEREAKLRALGYLDD